MSTMPRPEVLEAKTKRYHDLDPIACQAYLMVRQVGDCMREMLDERLSTEGISYGRFMLLVILDRDPEQPLAASELAEHAGVTKQTVTSLLDGLEKDGFISRKTDPRDRRSVMIKLQPQGSEILQHIMPGLYRKQVEMMKDLTRDEQKLLIQLLKKVQVCADEQRHTESNTEAVCR
jgi:MarR family transcriptional regulator, negative regulator of the multidrug operon emrRAB